MQVLSPWPPREQYRMWFSAPRDVSTFTHAMCCIFAIYGDDCASPWFFATFFSIGGGDCASPWDHKKPDAIGGVRNIEVGGPRSLSSRTCTLGRTCWCALKRHPRVVRFLDIYFYAILGWSSCSIHSNQIGGWGAVYNLLSSSGAAKSGRPGVKFSSTGGVGTSPRLDAVGKGWAHPC